MELPIFVLSKKLINAGDVSANIPGVPLEIKEILTGAIQTVWTGSTPIGTLVIQGSCDGVNFTTLASGSQSISGNSGSFLLPLADIGYSYIQAVYTKSSGTGTINVTLNGKR